MKKNTIYMILLVGIILAVGVINYASDRRTTEFIGADGKKIMVHTNNITNCNNGEIEKEDISLGDVIEQNGVKEVVIGIAEDGRYITEQCE